MSATVSTCRISPMTLADYDGVLQLWRNSDGVGLSESDSRANIAAYLERNPGMSYVAKNGERIIGAALCGHDGRRGYLHHLAVAKEHRRQGIGARLVEGCLARLKALGIPKCNIFVYADNADGEEFWRGRGWAKRSDLRVMQKTVG